MTAVEYISVVVFYLFGWVVMAAVCMRIPPNNNRMEEFFMGMFWPMWIVVACVVGPIYLLYKTAEWMAGVEERQLSRGEKAEWDCEGE